MNRASALKVIEEWLINPKLKEYDKYDNLFHNQLVIDRLKETLEYVKENLK